MQNAEREEYIEVEIGSEEHILFMQQQISELQGEVERLKRQVRALLERIEGGTEG